MIRRDLLKKEIDQLGKVLARLVQEMLRLKEQGQAPEAADAAWQSLKEEGLEPEHLLSLPADQFLTELESRKVSTDNQSLLAELYYQMAEAYWEQQDSLASQLYSKAAVLFQHLQQQEKDFSLDRYYKLQRAQQRQGEI